MSLPRHSRFSVTSLAGLLSLVTLFSCAVAEVTTLHQEELISDMHLDAKNFEHYVLQITSNIYKGDDHLAITAFSESFNSDPDLFISKTMLITNPTDNEIDWQCQRDGTDTCILPKGSFEIGDILYITVFCMRECDYSIRAYYAEEVEVAELARTTYRWGGHSTALVKFKIPLMSKKEGSRTQGIEVRFQPERPYSQVDVFVSYDDTYNFIQDKAAQHILHDGVAYAMNTYDDHWCVECYIYFVVTMKDDMRIYITADAQSRVQSLRGVSYDMLINEGRFKCYSYSVGSIRNDVQIQIEHLQGNADYYLARRDRPSSPISSAIKLSTPSMHPRQVMIATATDRAQWDAELGQYYVCAESYSTVSADVIVKEEQNRHVYGAHKDWQYNFLLQQGGHTQLIYEQDELWTREADLHIKATVWSSQAGDYTPLKIYYGLCNDNEGDAFNENDPPIQCGIAEWSSDNPGLELLTVTEQPVEYHGDRYATKTEYTNGLPVEVGDVEISFTYTAKVHHDPSKCANDESCKYIFIIYNPSAQSDTRQTSFEVTEILPHYIEDIEPGKAYRDHIGMDQYRYYRILDSQFDLEYIYQLILDLRTFRGDADIFVSTDVNNMRPTVDEFDLQSRRVDFYDQITLTDTVDNFMSNHIFISIYGNVDSDFELDVKKIYHPHYNEKLEYAEPLVDGEPLHVYFENEWESRFLSFQPWWSGHEDRTVVFLADSMKNDVTFYLAVDDYPLIYQTDWVARNEMFSVHPDQLGYTYGRGHFGTYFIRVRPGYILSDLIVNDPYEFHFHAFSQPSGNGLTDLYANEQVVGVAFAGQNTYYRHFLTDINHTVQITLYRMDRKGLPKLMVKFKDEVILPESNNHPSVDEEAATGENDEGFVQIWLHKERRQQYLQNCDVAGYPKQGGRELCGIYIGIECSEGEFMCAYKLELTLLEYTEYFSFGDKNSLTEQQKIQVQVPPPRYVPRDVDYVDAVVKAGEEMQFYYPFIPEEAGDILILVNKTGPIHSNGDSSLAMNVQADATQAYTNWTLPYHNAATARSRTFDPVQPEMIDADKDKLQQACDVANSGPDCAILFSVRGETDYLDSHFRVKVFNGTNRLYPFEPIQDSLQLADTYKYYWFVSTAAMAATPEIPNWLHEIGVGIQTPGMDVDMYVSIMDGRFPTEDDYDYKSVNLGSDWVTISSNDTKLRNENQHSWNPRVGMVVVVGVKARFNGASAYSVTLRGPNPSFYDFETMLTDQEKRITVPENPLRSKDNPEWFVFKWYNWNHEDFEFGCKMYQARNNVRKGAADFFLNAIGETSFEENAISGLPLSAANSMWFTYLDIEDGDDQDSVTIYKYDTEVYPQFCYNCWYYLTVKITEPEETKFLAIFASIKDIGDEQLELEIGRSTRIEIDEQGQREYVRFQLDSKDPFEIELEVSIGVVLVQVSKDPEQVNFDPIWDMQQDVGQGKISIGKDDPRFHMATWYYISIQSLQGSAIASVRINRQRLVSVLANNYPHKFQYYSAHEIVKFMVFEVPSDWSNYFETTIEVHPLSDNIYPSLYLRKIELQDVPERFEDLEYPNVVDYDLKFGDNFSHQLYNDKATYEFSGFTYQPRTYYTMAVYSHNYGLNDIRKGDFKLTVKTVEKIRPDQPVVTAVHEVEPLELLQV